MVYCVVVHVRWMVGSCMYTVWVCVCEINKKTMRQGHRECAGGSATHKQVSWFDVGGLWGSLSTTCAKPRLENLCGCECFFLAVCTCVIKHKKMTE